MKSDIEKHKFAAGIRVMVGAGDTVWARLARPYLVGVNPEVVVGHQA